MPYLASLCCRVRDGNEYSAAVRMTLPRVFHLSDRISIWPGVTDDPGSRVCSFAHSGEISAVPARERGRETCKLHTSMALKWILGQVRCCLLHPPRSLGLPGLLVNDVLFWRRTTIAALIGPVAGPSVIAQTLEQMVLCLSCPGLAEQLRLSWKG